MLPEDGLHVGPGGEGAFRQEVGVGVQCVVEDLQPEVGHPDLVAVGVNEDETGADARRVLMDRVPFAVRVARGFAHAR